MPLLSNNNDARPRTVWILLSLTLVFSAVWLSPPLQSLQGIEFMPLWAHNFAETFSVVVAMLVFGVAWNAYNPQRPGNIIIIACALLAVGLLDFAHMLSFRGMPDFITPASREKGLDFWLPARLFAALSLLVVAIRPWQPFRQRQTRFWWLAGSFAVTLAIYWLTLFHAELWPRTFIEGRGLTFFKIAAEYTIVAILLVPAVLFYLQAGRTQEVQAYDATSLFAAAVITILSELCFTLYSEVQDVFNLLGHLYKIVAYVFIYRAVFVSSVREPFTGLQQARDELHTSQQMLHSILDNVPVRIFWKDRAGRYLGGNQLFLRDAGMGEASQLIGGDDLKLFPAHARHYRADDSSVLESGAPKLNYEEPFINAHGDARWVMASKVPLHAVDGNVIGILGTYVDITERKQAEESMRLAATVFESSGEAIIITDAQSRIISVNQACILSSGYSKDELLGKNPHVLSSGKHDADFYRNMWECLERDGFWQGEIWDKHKNGRVYPKLMSISAVKNERKEVSHYISIAADISERKEAEQSIHMLAYYDVLTGLPNRTLLHVRLDQLIAGAHRDDKKFSLLFVDLDRFKYINDSMGHTTGDRLLQMIAQRIQSCVREVDTVARIGGDEFVVLVREAPAEEAELVANKLLKLLAEAYRIDEHELVIHASIGISVYPDHATDRDGLIKHADSAMHHAKDSGRNNYQIFAPEMNFRAHQIFSFEKDLRVALEKKQFELYYQPQVDLATGKICGAEALLRWKHPEKGYISPAEFIPVAEETGQIMEIGTWVLRTACNQFVQWQSQGMAVFPVAVNLSIRQLRQPDLASFVGEVLHASGLSPSSLELEITEGIMMGDSDQALNILGNIQKMGVQMSIDDFGTGFSSLSYLKRLPVNTLKIDQSFVRDVDTDDRNASIVRSIIGLGHRFNLKVIAEGVETLEQLDFLRVRGCDRIQGYYFSRPLPAHEFLQFINSHPKLP